jgi:hypothetical protein
VVAAGVVIAGGAVLVGGVAVAPVAPQPAKRRIPISTATSPTTNRFTSSPSSANALPGPDTTGRDLCVAFATCPLKRACRMSVPIA